MRVEIGLPSITNTKIREPVLSRKTSLKDKFMIFGNFPKEEEGGGIDPTIPYVSLIFFFCK